VVILVTVRFDSIIVKNILNHARAEIMTLTNIIQDDTRLVVYHSLIVKSHVIPTLSPGFITPPVEGCIKKYVATDGHILICELK
jgi:hypothetical protein